MAILLLYVCFVTPYEAHARSGRGALHPPAHTSQRRGCGPARRATPATPATRTPPNPQ